jgi:hypothetical protein
MRTSVFCVLRVASCLLLASSAAAQTSTIAGTVRDTSGAVLPGVTVEVTSPALIEKVRTTITDAEGRYQVASLRPGVYSVTFTLPGFGIVKRDEIELTSDFTGVVNAEMRVGTLEETITVTGESPIVDTQGITQRVVMTRDVLDVLPTGRNIQAVGIMIPGTALSLGGGGALSRDVGGSGQLQQSPLQYRGSGDTVQTIEGLRLNNLCAGGQYSGVYWNDASFEEISYVTGADSAEMGQGGMRVNMVPRDGGNVFHGQFFGNYAGENFTSDNCGSPGFVNGVAQPCTRSNLTGSTTFNPNNKLSNVDEVIKIWDVNPSIGGPIKRDRLWFYYTFRHWGTEKTKAGAYPDLDPSPFVYRPDTANPGVDDGHIVSNAVRVSWAVSGKDKITSYFDNQRKYRDHWGIAATIPPEAAAIQVTPTSFVSASKWTRTHTNRLMLEAGFGLYNQEYTELYQPSVTGITDKVWDLNAIRDAKQYTIVDQSNNQTTNAWNSPADHFSVLRTFMGAASYVTGSHNFRGGLTWTTGDWRLVEQYTGDVQPITYSSGRPVSVTLRLPNDMKNGIKRDLGIFLQDRWMMGRITLNLGLRYDQFIGETRESLVLPNRFTFSELQHGVTYGECPDGKAAPGCYGEVQNWKDISPRVGFAMDVFGNGRTAVKASIARYVAGQNVAVARQVNPVEALSRSDVRPWTNDVDGNGFPLDANGAIQFNELGTSTATPTFGRNVSTTRYDPEVLDGWFKRGYNLEWTVAAQHQLADRISVNGGYYRRSFGNQTFTDNLAFDANDYDSLCINAPADPRLPYGDGQGYQVCGVQDLKPAVAAQNRPTNNVIRFSDDLGGETNMYQGFDVNIEARFRNAAFLKAGVGASSRLFDNCNLLPAGLDAVVEATRQGTEIYPDGTTSCRREYPYRPDLKLSGSYTLPWDIVLAGTYQYSRGVQTGGAGPSIQANFNISSGQAASLGARPWNGAASRTIQLIREGLMYGDHDLNQLDVKLAKRFTFGEYRVRFDFDIYNVFNSSWPYTVTSTYSTAPTTTWLRPTNVLQSRFFKLGAQFSF